MIHIDNAPPGRHYSGIPNLFLHVTPRGQRRWVARYSRPHKAGVTEMSLGSASQANFAYAQQRLSQLRLQLAQGIDPVAHARTQQRASITFAVACSQWIDHSKGVWSASQLRNANLLLRVHGATLASLLVPTITEDNIVTALKSLWDATPKQARRALDMWKRVLDMAGRRGNNPAAWKGNMEYRFPRSPKQAKNHYPAMTYSRVPLFIAVILPSQVRSTGAVALEFLILTATRSDETLKMPWSEVDFTNRIWTIPKERTKPRREHQIPLCDRAMEILQRQREYSSGSPFVFTGYSDAALAKKTMVPFLREMGSTDTVHGFRASFKSWATDTTEYPLELIELSLGHAIGNQTSEAYRRVSAVERRRPLMQSWGDFCTKEFP
jgi:integrase